MAKSSESAARRLSTESEASCSPGTTSVRFVILFLATSLAMMLYLDRVCVSPAGEAISRDLKLSREEFDDILSAFFLTYALAQIPSGWLGDRFGARWMLAAYAILWSLTTAGMSLVTGGAGLLWLRMACGLFQSGAYPVAAGVVRRWVPMHRRGFASSVIAVGGRLGGALAPVLTVQLMLFFSLGINGWLSDSSAVADAASWRPVMMLFGIVGILLALGFAWYVRDRPEDHPAVGEGELKLILGDQGSPVGSSVTTRTMAGMPPMLAMMLSIPLWLSSFVQFASNLGWAFLVTRLPVYLKEVFQTTLEQQGWLQSLPLIGGIAGMLMGGFLTDELTRRFGLRWGRALAMGGSRLLVALAFLSLLWTDSAMGATVCLSLVGLATDLGTPACWAMGQDIGGRHVGSVFGWANMWGNLGAALSPKLFGWIVASSVSVSVGWKTAFITCAVVNLIAAVAGFLINTSRTMTDD
ncbi:MAG: MFS transporter [Planctomycetota bacterium]